MDILEKLKWRYATKAFDPNKKLSDQQLNTLLESLRLSASSFGLQPWKFAVITDQKLKSDLKAHSWNQAQVEQASHVLVLCGRTDVNEAMVDHYIDDMIKVRGAKKEDLEGFSNMMKGFLERMNEEKKAHWVKDQVYIALGNLLTVCAVEGIDSCPMEGFIPEEYDKALGLKEKNLTSVVVCPVGFRANDDKYAELPKVRYSLEDLTLNY